MELQFTQTEKGFYVAEFEATADFNLHVERKAIGQVLMYQSTGTGDYALVEGVKQLEGKTVFDYDFTALIYPKRIKIVSMSEPTYAVITSEGEVTEYKVQSKSVEVTGNGSMVVTPDAGFAYLDAVTVKTNVPSQGGEGGEFKARYFDTTEVPSDMILGVVSYSVAIKAQKQILFTTTVGVTEELDPEAVMWLEGVPLALSADEGVMMDSNFIESLKGVIAEQGGTLTEITKEEFYNIN